MTFRYGQTIRSAAVEAGRVAGIETDRGRVTGDAYVSALGTHGPRVLDPIGITLPVYPVKGYSITLPVTDDAMAPQSTIMDETHKVAITRLGTASASRARRRSQAIPAASAPTPPPPCAT